MTNNLKVKQEHVSSVLSATHASHFNSSALSLCFIVFQSQSNNILLHSGVSNTLFVMKVAVKILRLVNCLC